MLSLDTPSTFLRDAWCRVRLDVIRDAVDETIVELEELVRHELETLTDVNVEPALDQPNARNAALRTCSVELKVECGLPVESETSLAPHDASWMFTYDEALARYRNAAVNSLRKSLGQATR